MNCCLLSKREAPNAVPVNASYKSECQETFLSADSVPTLFVSTFSPIRLNVHS